MLEIDLLDTEESGNILMQGGELSVSFGYDCHIGDLSGCTGSPDETNFVNDCTKQNSGMKLSSSFSCLSGAALSANATLANTNICNGLIGEEILPSLDSPTSFRRIASSSSLSRLDMSALAGTSIDEDGIDFERNLWKSVSDPTRTESNFLDAMDLQMAGGAAGEDRVQAVCSEGNGWLFCGIYDGFNGRDAADFLAGTFYENICFYLFMLESRMKKRYGISEEFTEDNKFHSEVLDCLTRALAQAESDFLAMVEQDMEDRPDLVSVGSCVLTMLLYGDSIYILGLGDSRAILASSDGADGNVPTSIQLTEIHSVDNVLERKRILSDHPDDPSPIIHGKVKGRLKLTRALGVGYLKKSEMNDVLIGILRIRNLISPPYIDNHPFTTSRRVSDKDQFVVLGSDGLFDFFSNDQVVQMVHHFIQINPSGDPAKYLVEQLIIKAATKAGFSTEDLMRVPAGSRRRYHDDVTIIVVMLGNKKRTSSASIAL